jgi:arsenite-transporting ATPase
MEEQLSGSCTMEIAAFDEFSKLLGDKAATAQFDHVIFDTAPTGHTLRLLELPAAWSTFIDANVGGTSCLGPLSGLSAQKALYAASNDALRDPAQTILVLVVRPERSSLTEAERTRAELAQLGVGNVRLILNGVFATRATRQRSQWRLGGARRSKRCLRVYGAFNGSMCRCFRSGSSGSTRFERWAH